MATLLVASLMLAGLGCSVERGSAPQGVVGEQGGAGSGALTQSAPAVARGEGDGSEAAIQDVSLSQADAARTAPAAAERKIIRNAALTVETDSPAEAMRRVASIAESRGGFVVTSESRQQTAADSVTPYEVVTVEVRVPAAQFDAVVGEIRGVGGRVVGEKLTGQDVTEEYIDLEARIRTQRALEAQFLEIMKGARVVSDALQVQRELANVRTEIERIEGRRRFLENQTSLSTIKVTLQPPAPLVNATGFGYGLRDALGDGIEAAATILLGLIRVFIALIPVALFVLLPLFLLVRYVVRRARRRTPPAEQLP
ncbi:MAG TPA: DUF4349 domain-containing protein [Pyrinomonadaceae bacterium]|nr:DUF4349 domain-containing protein [Pyrinomonadaceae bacterium]